MAAPRLESEDVDLAALAGEPFVKLDRARGHGAGYGLGLDLCRRIVRLRGGTLRLAPRQPRGTEAVVIFHQP